MGLLDNIESMAGMNQRGEGGSSVNVSSAVMQAMQQHPGGLQGVMDSFKQNGMGDHVNALANGQEQTTSPEQVQQGLGGTGLIESTAQKAGISPQVAQMAIAALMPMVMRHFASTGQAPQQSEMGGMAQQLLSRFL